MIVTQHVYSQLCVKYSVKSQWQLCFKMLLVIKPCQHGKCSRKQGKIALCVQEDQEEPEAAVIRSVILDGSKEEIWNKNLGNC